MFNKLNMFNSLCETLCRAVVTDRVKVQNTLIYEYIIIIIIIITIIIIIIIIIN